MKDPTQDTPVKPVTNDQCCPSGTSRRDFLKVGAGAVAGVAASQLFPNEAKARDRDGRDDDFLDRHSRGKRDRNRRTLIKGGIVLSLDPKVGDFESADVLVEGKKIVAVGPNLHGGGEEIDARGMVVMPGFITTHHHQYETLQRSIIADGLLAGAWPQETYGSVVQNIWTAGRITDPQNPGRVIWDLGRVPYDPEDCYIAELVACVSEITQGITTGTDTSQANHTPEHTDAMVKALKDSGRRMVFAYSAGTDRSGEGVPFEFPGAMNDTAKGIGRVARTHFASRDQLVTLGFAGGPGLAFPGAPYTGWQLGRSFGASLHNHMVGNSAVIVDA